MKLYESIEPNLEEWIMKQQVFFSASAALRGKYINVSPKGLPASSFKILGPNLCAYVDATGSGVETIANIYENGRVTLMFCSFETSPRILRLFCTGRVVEWDQPDYRAWHQKLGDHKVIGARAIIVLDVFKVQTSCGFAVPYLALRPDMEDPTKKVPYLEDRQTLGHWGDKVIAKGEMDDYRRDHNSVSLNGLPGMSRARRDAGEYLWLCTLKDRVTPAGGIVSLMIVAILSSSLTVVSIYMTNRLRL